MKIPIFDITGVAIIIIGEYLHDLCGDARKYNPRLETYRDQYYRLNEVKEHLKYTSIYINKEELNSLMVLAQQGVTFNQDNDNLAMKTGNVNILEWLYEEGANPTFTGYDVPIASWDWYRSKEF